MAREGKAVEEDIERGVGDMNKQDLALDWMRFFLLNKLRGILDRAMLAELRLMAETDDELRDELEELGL